MVLASKNRNFEVRFTFVNLSFSSNLCEFPKMTSYEIDRICSAFIPFSLPKANREQSAKYPLSYSG